MMDIFTLAAGGVILSPVEEPGLAAVAASSLYVFFTHAATARRLTQPAGERSSLVAVTGCRGTGGVRKGSGGGQGPNITPFRIIMGGQVPP